MVTLVERHSRYLLVLPLLDATTSTVVAAVTAAFQRLPPTMRRSLTWDRAVEMTQHADFTAATGIPVYFCDAYCRGSTAATRTATDCCDNTSRRNRPIPTRRRSRPHRGQPLNSRPRQSLGWQTPHEVLWVR
jgi:IS30 family transposase